jgi:hypothetical protein
MLRHWLSTAGSVLLGLAFVAFFTWAIFPVQDRRYLFVFLGLMVLVGIWLYRGAQRLDKEIARHNRDMEVK